MDEGKTGNGLPSSGAAGELFTLAANAAGLTVWEWDLFRDQSRVVGAGATLLDPLLNHPQAARAGLLGAVHPDDRAAVASALERAIAGDDRFALDFRLVRDGAIAWVHGAGQVLRDEAGAATRLVGVSQEVTAWLRAQGQPPPSLELRPIADALRASEERLRTLTELAPSIVWTADPDGVITYASEQWYRYCGLDPAENARGWPDFVLHPDDRERCLAAWTEALREGREYAIEVRNRRHDGVYRWFLTRAVPQRDTSGAIVAWFGATTDIDERKRAEEALADSEATLRGFYDHAPVLMGVVELTDDGDVIHIYDSPSSCRFFGLEVGATSGRRSSALGTPPEMIATWRRRYEESARTGGPVRFEYVDERATGTIWLEVTVAPLATASERPRFCYVANDISERRRSEAAAQEAERFRQRVTDVAPSIVYVYDLASGRYVFINHPFRAHLGYAPADHADPPLSFPASLLHDDDRAVLDQHEARLSALADGETAPAEYRLRHADGSWRWFLRRDTVFNRRPDGAVSQVIGAASDISEQKEAEEALARLNEAERAARRAAEQIAARVRRLHNLSNALAGALSVEEVAAVAVGQAETLLGAPARALALVSDEQAALRVVGAAAYPEALRAPGWREPLGQRSPWTAAIETGEAHFWPSRAGLIADYPHLDDERFAGFEAGAALPLRVGGRVGGVLALGFGRRRRYSAAERTFLTAFAQQCAQALANAQLYEAEQQARIDAQAAERVKDEFLSVAAHELKTPLTVLQGYTYLLSRRVSGQTDPWLTQAFAVLGQETERLGRLVNNLLDISRRARGRLELEPTTFSLAQLATETCDRLQGLTTRHRLLISSEGEPERLRVTADRERIDQVLVNLISNAIVYSPAGGDIAVSVTAELEGVVVAVRDPGIGIPAERQGRLFEQFYRAHRHEDRDRQGMGIGLYLSRELVHAHGGAIWFESAEGAGSTFSFRLPAAEPAAP